MRQLQSAARGTVFDLQVNSMSDSKRVATNIIASWGANLVKALVQLLMLPLMARVLGPAEMGLYSLALPIVSLVMPLADAGLANSLAREPTSNHRVWSTAFWMLQAIALVLAAGVIGGSYFVAFTANQPRLQFVTMALSVIFPLLSFGVLPMARMIQKGRLVAPAMIDMTSNILGAGLGVFCAFSGFGVWAMVCQYVAVFFVRAVLLNICEFYRPHFVISFVGLKSHLQLGSSVTASKVMEFGGRIAENSQVSRALGPVALGTYGFSTQVARFLSEAVGNSIWANLYYKSLHASEDELGSILIKMTRLLCLILMPGCFLAGALAPTILPMLLGQKWAMAEWPLAIFCLTAPFTVVSTMTSSVLYARGNAKVPMAIAAVTAVARFLAILLFSTQGLLIACVAVGSVSLAQCALAYFVSRKLIGFRIRSILRHTVGPIVMSALGFVAALAIAYSHPSIESGAIGVLAFVGVYFIGQVLFDRALFIPDIKGVLGLLSKRPKTATEVVG